MANVTSSECRNAVAIRHGYKSYDGVNHILRGINITIREGTIYGLLGPSGCGKTTLLNFVVGLIGLDSGTIELSVNSKEQVGYMPQIVCLYDQLTLDEQLNYYGTMYGMDPEKKESQIDRVLKILELPNRDLMPPQLSGGQRRRVSLAIALIHDPKLLILDEPTVGVDPLLRERIWNFLYDWISPGGKTILMTTHYIDEARQTNTVGLMRDGVMLCEAPPELVGRDFGTDSIEEAFFKLAQRQQKQNEIKRLPEVVKKKSVYSPLTEENTTFVMSKFLEEMKKNVYFIIRNLPVALFIFTLPTLCTFLAYYGCGRKPEGLSLGVVNEDFPFGSENCDSYGNQLNNCTMKYLSCVYLKKLRGTTMKLVDYGSVDEAIERMKDTNIRGVLYFPTNYTKAMRMRIAQPFTKDDGVIDNSMISAYLDGAEKIIYDMIGIDLRTSFMLMMREIYAGCNLPLKHFELPIKIEKPIYGGMSEGHNVFLASAVLSVIMLAMPLAYGCILLIEEKNCGAISRALVAGATLLEIFTANMFVQICIHSITTLSAMFSLYIMLGTNLQQPILTALLLMLEGCVGITMAMYLSTITNSLILAACITVGFLLATIIVAGLFWPTEAIHSILKPFSLVAPFTLPSQAIRSMTVRGWDLTYAVPLMGFFITISWIFIFSILTYIYVKINKIKLFLPIHVH